MKTTYQRAGVRYRKIRSRDNSYGPGKVHVGRWCRPSQNWEPICDFPEGKIAFIGRGWDVLDDVTTPTECKRCIRLQGDVA